MRLRLLNFLCCFVILALTFLPNSPSLAQTPAQQPISYQAVLLNDASVKVDFADKFYAIPEDQKGLSAQMVEDMVRNGRILPYQSKSGLVNLGYGGQGIWLVLPIANNGSQEVWTLNLGSFGTGRYSSFKDIILYNLNTRTYLLDTQSLNNKTQSIPSTIHLKIPARQTTFYLLYLKPYIGAQSYINPSLSIPNQTDLMQTMGGWLSIILGFSAFFYFLKIAKDNKSRSHLFMSLLWLGLSTTLLLNTNFLHTGTFEMEVFFPLIWILTSLLMIMCLLSIGEGRNKLPLTFFGGMASLFLISGLAGLVIMKSIPTLSIYLIYGPTLLGCLLVTVTCWSFVIRDKSNAYLPLALVSFFIGALIEWIGLLCVHIVPATSFTVLVPQILMCAAIISSIIGSMAPALQDEGIKDDSAADVFMENQLVKKEMLQIHEAKEQSEHRRLMQVIEQERKLMSELQVKGAQQNEEMRKAKEAADEANRAKSAFLAIVSHEIRTPMTGIMGMLRLLQDTQLSKDQKEYTSTIKDSGDAMLALLNDILDFEKIESGKMDLENINFDLKRLVRGVYTLMKGHAEAKNVDIVLEVDPSTPSWVRGDPTRLRQVLLNLINNAIKFTSKGTVYLRVRDLTGGNDDKPQRTHQIYFAIQDSGIGIGQDAQKKLFMPFAQADSSISRKYGGTGLGLAICKRLIEAMGGAISINSKESEGSTFFFTLSMPAGNEMLDSSDDRQRIEDITPYQPVMLKSVLNVLIVDDNGINQKVVAGFVDKLGGRSMLANSGADALDMLARYQFDLILMDIQLPDMSGIEVTELIRKLSIPGKANVPIVALTGNTDTEDMKACYDAGMNDFATKPITFEKISELLSKVENQSYFKRSIPQILHFAAGEGESDDEIAFTANDTTVPDDDIVISNTDTSFLDDESLDLDEDEEDSFALAVKKFEEMEKQDSNAAPVSTVSATGTLADVGLDEDILKSLRSGLSVAQIQEILVSFYEKADELIADIGNAYLEKNTVNLYARAHELKGMAGNFGFSGISKMSATIEKAAKDNQLDIAKDPIDHLGDNYAVARGQLNKWLVQK